MSWSAKLLSGVGVLLSVILGASVSDPIVVWIAMEVNLLMFVGLLVTSTYPAPQMEMGVSYFILQSLSSLMIILLMVSGLFVSVKMSSLFMEFFVLVKLGAVPAHGWFISISQKVGWFEFFLLSTWQKILPLTFLLYMNSSSLVFGVISSSVAAILGFKELSVKKALAISSIFNLGWMLVSVSGPETLWPQFLLIYAIFVAILIGVMKLIAIGKSLNFSQQRSEMEGAVFLGMIGLAGLPPFPMFFLKVKLVSTLQALGASFVALSLLVSSALMLYLYLMLILTSTTNSLSKGLSFHGSSVGASSMIFSLLISSPLVYMWVL